MSFQFKKILSSAVLSGVFLAISGTAHATSYTWVGPDNAPWNNAANWSPKGVPTVGDTVVIGSKKKVAVPVDATVANLVVGAGAEIKNGANIKVTGNTTSSGVFTGVGTLNVPPGATAALSVDAASVAATTGSSSSTVVFAPITNKGRIITNVAHGCRVDFASIDNTGSTQITSDGMVTFKDIKNAQDMNVSASGSLTLAKIENATGGSVSISASSSATTLVPSTTTNTKGTRAIVDPSVVHLDDLINHAGGKVKLLGNRSGRYFNGKSIRNEGEMEISGAQTLLEADVNNLAGATLTLDSDATLFPSDGTVPKLNNAGKLIKAAGSDATLKVEWNNTGQVVVEDGTLHVRLPAGKNCKQMGGITTLEGGALAVENPEGAPTSSVFEVAGGVVDGIGTIQGSVLNSGGHFKPGHSPGTIVINGNFTQTAGGILDMEVGGTTPGTSYDQILVNGTAYLGGTLNMVRWGGYVPKNGDVYTLFTYYAKLGSFDKFVDTLPVSGISYSTTLTPTTYEVNCFGSPDTAAPVAAISTPVNASAVKSVTAATGKASDAIGLKSVTCRLYRYANPVTGTPAGYWAGGTTWTTTATGTNDRLATGTGVWTFTLPPLVAGRYSLQATSTDTSGNKGYSTTNAFYVDPNAPSVLTADTPINGATISALTSLGGAVSDASDGSGISLVQVQLRRASDNFYWTGSAWSSTATSLGTSLASGRWSRATGLPTGTNLKAGSYTITATATDKAGNTKTATSKFIVSSVTTSALTSSVRTG